MCLCAYIGMYACLYGWMNGSVFLKVSALSMDLCKHKRHGCISMYKCVCIYVCGILAYAYIHINLLCLH